MLKNLVRERLIAAADEIFELFEKTIASYEEQVCRAREETERRRQLEAFCDTQIVIRVQDVQQPICRPEELPHQSQRSSLEREDPQHLHVKEEEEEADVGKLPLTRVSLKSEDEPPEWSQLHHQSPSGDHCGGPPPDNLLAPLSDSDDMEEPLRSDENCEKGNIIKHIGPHSGEKPFSCTTCGTAFRRKQHLEIHLRKHTGKKLFRCLVCGKEIINKSAMVRHMRIHTGEKPFSCSVCSKPFIEKGNMMKHMRVHTGEKPFTCPTCCKTFSRKQHLEIHEDTHRRNTL
ncbi:gastrula zinc finger protein xLCGF3.1-like [Phycodurus eques]|uniref:gastrula zinc finger protein xLCGF3.1-like n=1 Tax=Phycodurus eques TaxID=693459 RepID=UPI002ACE299A|nr:gastrula zinc finger protein xLCGF3.1-like [Phycodurus eques]